MKFYQSRYQIKDIVIIENENLEIQVALKVKSDRIGTSGDRFWDKIRESSPRRPGAVTSPPASGREEFYGTMDPGVYSR